MDTLDLAFSDYRIILESIIVYLIENEELVTPTLAKVYFEQHHYEKAINAYKKLILKYPKKSTFFAAQIELIKNKIK